MRPITFSPLAPSATLTMGKGATQGFGDAVKSYYQARNQRMQMQSMQDYRQGQAQFMQARAAALARQNQNVNFAKVQAVNDLHNLASTGQVQFDPDTSGKMVAHVTKQALDGIKTPADAQQLQARVAALSSQAGDMSLNPGEQKFASGLASNQTKENVAQTAGVTRENAATTYGNTRVQAAKIQASGRVASSQIMADRPGQDVGDKADLQSMKDLNAQMLSKQNMIAGLDKPPPIGVPPMDPTVKATLKNQYSQDLADLHGQYQQAHDRLSPPPSAPNGNPPPGGSSSPVPPQAGGNPPKIHTLQDLQGGSKPAPGDFIKGPSGFGKVQADGSVLPATAPPSVSTAAPPPPVVAPPAAPAAPNPQPGQ